MTDLEPRYSKTEFERLGQAIYKRDIVSRLSPDDDGKFVAIDVETGTYEIDDDDFAATERLIARRPGAQIWLVRAGRRAAYRLGAQLSRKEP